MIKYLLSLILILVVVVPVAAQTEAKEHIIRGNNLYLQKDYEKAELQYKQALSKDSNSIKANYNLGNTLYQQGKFEEARTHYQKTLNQSNVSNEDRQNAFYNIGKIYLDEKNGEMAVKNFKEALRLNPYDEARYNLALAKRLLEEQQSRDQEGGSQKDSQEKKGTENSEESKSENNNNPSKQDENKGNQSQGGENGNEKGKGNLPREQEITKGSDGKGEEAPEAQSNEIHENVLKGLEQQEQETLKKIISQKAKKVRTKTEKDW